MAEPTRLVQSDSITLWLFAPPAVQKGEPVPMRVEIENTSSGPIRVELAGRTPHADFVVSDAAGSELWRLYQGIELLMNQELRRLGSGERLVFPHTWSQATGGTIHPGPPVEAGRYRLRARVRLGGSTVETPARTLRILEGPGT